MSRMDRLRELKNPTRRENWRGAGRDQANIDRWSDRAEVNSEIAPRAKDTAVRLPPTGGPPSLRDTASRPFVARQVDAAIGNPSCVIAPVKVASYMGADTTARNVSTGGATTGAGREDKARAAAKRDLNDVGSSFMPGVRRGTN